MGQLARSLEIRQRPALAALSWEVEDLSNAAVAKSQQEQDRLAPDIST